MNYPSTDPVHRERWSDREVVDGNIVQALRLLIERFERLVPNPFALEADGFTRRAVGPHVAPLREALVNLLVHQDHGDHRIARVLWYSDKIVFDNPGDSLVPVSDMIAGGSTDCRNPTIQRVLRMAQLAEQAGSGVVGLRESWQDLTGRLPTISNDPAQKTYEIEFPWAQEGATEERAGPGSGEGASPVIPPVNPVAPPGTPHVTPPVTPHAPHVTPHVTPHVAQLLAVLDGEMNRGELLERLGLRDRMHFTTTYLAPATEAGLVERTIPDRPRSSRQKYRLTAAGRALRTGVPGGGAG